MQRVRILETENVTHDVRRFRFERPEGYAFLPGQATEVAIDREGWREKKRPFTFTGLKDADDLEFVTKMYPDHEGVTAQLATMGPGDSFLIDDPWGTIRYKGRGTFIAGGAGITPFIAILRNLAADGSVAGHRLLFANKTEEDIILRKLWETMPGLDHLFLTDDGSGGFPSGRIDKAFLESHVDDFAQAFYVCGPRPMVKGVNTALTELGAAPDALVFER